MLVEHRTIAQCSRRGKKMTLYNLLQHVFRWWFYYHFIHTNKQKLHIWQSYHNSELWPLQLMILTQVYTCAIKKKVPLGYIYTETWNVNTGPYVTAKLISNALQCFDQFHNIAITITNENNGHNLECRGMEESTIMVIYQHQIEQYQKRCPPPLPTINQQQMHRTKKM